MDISRGGGRHLAAQPHALICLLNSSDCNTEPPSSHFFLAYQFASDGMQYIAVFIIILYAFTTHPASA